MKLTQNNSVDNSLSTEPFVVDTNLEYCAATANEFMLYDKETETWTCLKTGLMVAGSVSDVINEHGGMWLHAKGKPSTYGKWFTAENKDELVEFFESGEYLNHI